MGDLSLPSRLTSSHTAPRMKTCESPSLMSPKLTSTHAEAPLAPFPNPVVPPAHWQPVGVIAQPPGQATSPISHSGWQPTTSWGGQMWPKMNSGFIFLH
jgi:hypothetical protein